MLYALDRRVTQFKKDITEDKSQSAIILRKEFTEVFPLPSHKIYLRQKRFHLSPHDLGGGSVVIINDTWKHLSSIHKLRSKGGHRYTNIPGDIICADPKQIGGERSRDKISIIHASCKLKKKKLKKKILNK